MGEGGLPDPSPAYNGIDNAEHPISVRFSLEPALCCRNAHADNNYCARFYDVILLSQANATWLSAEPVHDLGDQIVVNATGSVPKNVTVFPDYYVYGANGACARAGYSTIPPAFIFCDTYEDWGRDTTTLS